MRDGSGFSANQFAAGTDILMSAAARNDGAAGTFNSSYEIVKSDIRQILLGQSINAPVGGSGSSSGLIQWASGAGQYRAGVLGP